MQDEHRGLIKKELNVMGFFIIREVIFVKFQFKIKREALYDKTEFSNKKIR